MNFVVFSTTSHDPLGEAFMILAMTVDTSMAGIGLALAMAIRRKIGTASVRDLTALKE